MKKIVLTLTAAMIFVWQATSFAASSVDALIQKLKDKGILTDQEAGQIKDEVSYDESESMTKSFKSQIPEWVSGLKISGDFRVRDQIQRTKKPTGGVGNDTRNRGRFRARLNLEDQVNDKLKINFTLATEGGSDNGTLANGRSNNVTFGGNGGTNSGSFAKPYVAIDKAFVTYTPNQYATVMAGKMANPIWEPGTMLWDPDITPEGGVIQLTKKINDYVTPFSTNTFFILKDSAPSATQKTDPYMFVTQDGIKGNLTEKVYYKLAGTYYGIQNPSDALLDNRAVGNTLRANGTQYKYNYRIVSGAMDLGMNDPLGDMLPSPLYIPQVGVFGEYSKNTAIAGNGSAYMMGGYMGNSAINGWGTWSVKSFYKVLEADSWLDALPNDDFYSGDTDTKGWQTELDLGLAKNVWFVMMYYHTDVYKAISNITNLSIKNSPEDIFQLDLNFKF